MDVVIDHYSSFPIYIAERDDLIPLFSKQNHRIIDKIHDVMVDISSVVFHFTFFVIRRGEDPPPYEYSINGIKNCNHRHIVHSAPIHIKAIPHN